MRLTASDWQRLLVKQGCGQLISWIWLPKANAQGQADAARVQGPGSESNAQGQADAQWSQASSAADPVHNGPRSKGQADAQGSDPMPKSGFPQLCMKLSKHEKLGPESDCAEVVPQVEQLKMCAEAHIDGMKHLNKTSKSYLDS